MRNKVYIILIFLGIFLSCKQDNTVKINSNSAVKNSIKHADYFEIFDYITYKKLIIKSKVQNETHEFFLVDKNNRLPKFLTHKKNVIRTPIEKIVVTSTTHIAMLELLDVENNLIAFPQTYFISSEKTQKRIKNGFVKELGNVQQMNTEILLTVQPDVIISFEITGSNKILQELENKGYTIIVNNDWLEATPLGRAEWIHLFGALFNKSEKANHIFKTIETNYNEAKSIASKATKKPTILSGIIYNDVWNMPAGRSFEAQFLKDANTTYLWENTTDTGSLLLSVEIVLEKGKDANLWVNPGIYTNYVDLEQSNTLYTHFKPFKNKQIYSYAHLKGETGGYIYFETAPTRPDLVLKDLIKIAHPELMRHYEFTFYKKLD